MLKGKIVPIGKEKVVNRDGTHIPACWERVRPGAKAPETIGPFRRMSATDESALARLVEGAAVVSVSVTGTTESPLLRIADQAAGEGIRTYVYGPPQFGGAAEVAAILRRRSERLLARRGGAPALEFLVVDRGARGAAIIGDGGEGGQRYFELDATQAEAAFRLFTHWFWNVATEEGLEGERKSFQFRPCRSAPFDVPPPTADAAIGPGTKQMRGGQSLIVEPDGLSAMTTTAAVVFSPPDGAADRWAERAGGGGVHWIASGLPALSLGDADAHIWLSGPAAPDGMRVALSTKQAFETRQALEKLAAQAEWELRRDITLKQVGGECWLPGQARALAPEARVTRTLADLPAEELFEMANAEHADPVQMDPPPLLAREVCYTFQVQPPRAPNQAKKAKLIEDWERTDDAFARRVAEAQAALREFNEAEQPLVKRLPGLVRALLGGNNRSDQIKKAVSELAATPPSKLGPAEARSVVEKLDGMMSDIHGIVEGRKADVAAEERRVEEERQRDEHRRVTDAARAKAEQREAELGPLREQVTGVDSQIGSLGEPPEDESGKKDFKARKASLHDEQHRLKKQVKVLEGEAESLRAEAARTFEFRPQKKESLQGSKPKQSGPLFVPPQDQRAAIAVPTEALPAVGELLEHDRKRFLAVTTWEAATAGIDDAKRLGAKLVVPSR